MMLSVEKENPGCLATLPQSSVVNQYRLKVKWLKASAALILCLVRLARIAVAQNLLSNPGFESGNPAHWFGFGSPTLRGESYQVHSGNYACLVSNRTATCMGIAQSVGGALAAGQTCNYSAWVQLASGTNQTMSLTFQQVDGSGTTYPFHAAGTVTTNDWTQLSGTFTFAPVGTVTSVTFYAAVPGRSTVPYYIDDASLSALYGGRLARHFQPGGGWHLQYYPRSRCDECILPYASPFNLAGNHPGWHSSDRQPFLLPASKSGLTSDKTRVMAYDICRIGKGEAFG